MSNGPDQPVVVAPFGPADYEDWLPLWRGYQAFYRTEIPLETTRVAWSRILDAGEPMWGALARVNGDYCYLQDLFVDASVRKTGAGRALIEHVYADARRAGSPRVYWLTHETNAEAIRLYDRIADRSGFIQYRKLLPGR